MRGSRAIEQPQVDEFDLAEILFALGDPVRLSVVSQLTTGALTPGRMEVAVSPATLSAHLRVLRRAGVIEQVAQGVRRITSLRREDLDRRYPGLLEAVLAAAGQAT